MKRKVRWLSVLLSVLLILIQQVPAVASGEGTTGNVLYVFNLKNFIDGLPTSKIRYDYLKIATAIQGLVNREKPQLYFLYEPNRDDKEKGINIDQYWLDKLSADGKYLSNFSKVQVTDFYSLFTMFSGYYNGVVLWDQDVPSTSNVASTIAGVESLLPVRYDTSKGSLYNDLFDAAKFKFSQDNVKMDLTGKFTGEGTIPDINIPSTGSAKDDAYIWAKVKYLDKGLTNPLRMTYSSDAWTKPIAAGSEERASAITTGYIPEKLNPGQKVQIMVTMKNMGTAAWNEAGMYRLGAGGNNQFVFSSGKDRVWTAGVPSNQRVFLPSDVLPGQEYTFSFNITAPSKTGTYTFEVQMVRDGVAWFGETLTRNIEITNDVLPTPIPELTDMSLPKSDVVYSKLFETNLANADFLIAQKAFFWDLSPDKNSYPIDDRNQPLGSDVKTLRAILKSQAAQAGNNIFAVSGFVPWQIKYTTASDSQAKLDPVPAEWTMVDVISQYGGEIEADAAAGTGDVSNVSVFSHVPLNKTFKQPNDKGESNQLVYDKDTKYVMFYMGDYDQASWASSSLPVYWDDPKRGQIPLAWSIDTGLSRRIPHVFNYLYDTATPNDYFVTGDNGTGYLNPMQLEAARRPDGMPDLLQVWEDHNIQFNKRFDMDITGFLIAGNTPFIPASVQEAYGKMTHRGVITQGSFQNQIYKGTPFVSGMDLGLWLRNGKSTADQIVAKLKSPKQFYAFRTILSSPSALVDAAAHIKAEHPEVKMEVVDPYTFMRLFKDAHGENPEPAVTYDANKAAAPVVVDGVANENEWSGASEMVVSPSSETVLQHGNIWGNFAGDADLKSVFKVKWDANNLYVLEEREDNVLNLSHEGDAPMYTIDASMLFLDLSPTIKGTNYMDGDYSIHATPSGKDGKPHIFLRAGNIITGTTETALLDATIKSTVTDKGYTMEYSVPWSALQVTPFTPKVGETVGMSVLAIDNDGSSGFKGQIMWVGNGDNQAGWAGMRFVDEISASTQSLNP